MIIYPIMVYPKDSWAGKLSGEGYRTLEAAQKFVESRSDNPKKLGDFQYASEDSDYLIYQLWVAEK